MIAVFYLTFNVIGAWLQGIVEIGVEAATGAAGNLLMAAGVNDTLE